MPILAYFAVTVPALLVALFLASAYLEPDTRDETAMLLGINPAHANTKTEKPAQEQVSVFHRLRSLPINGRP